MVQVTVPPTLIVVTGVPLLSSCHLKFDPLTLAVVGAPGPPGDGDVGGAVGDAGAGEGVEAEAVGVGVAPF